MRCGRMRQRFLFVWKEGVWYPNAFHIFNVNGYAIYGRLEGKTPVCPHLAQIDIQGVVLKRQDPIPCYIL